jgi:hypothetical protein
MVDGEEEYDSEEEQDTDSFVFIATILAMTKKLQERLAALPPEIVTAERAGQATKDFLAFNKTYDEAVADDRVQEQEFERRITKAAWTALCSLGAVIQKCEAEEKHVIASR